MHEVLPRRNVSCRHKVALLHHGFVAWVAFCVATDRGVVTGSPAPRNSVRLLLVLLTTHTFPDGSMATPLGPDRPLPVMPPLGVNGAPALENSETLPLALAIQMFPDPSIDNATGWFKPPPVNVAGLVPVLLTLTKLLLVCETDQTNPELSIAIPNPPPATFATGLPA